MISCIFAAKLPALKEVWMVGDDFLNSTYDTFITMRKRLKKEENAMPYIYKQYNISYLIEDQLEGNTNAVAKILNAVIKGLNETAKLPRFIIIIPENDILKSVNYFGFGISVLVGRCLNWLVTQIDRAVEARREKVKKIRPGAVFHNEPKYVWLKVFDCPSIQHPMFTVREKYNAILEEILASKCNHFIINVNKAMSNPTFFMPNGLITAHAQEAFWQELDNQIELFDLHKLPEAKLRAKVVHQHDQQHHLNDRFYDPRRGDKPSSAVLLYLHRK